MQRTPFLAHFAHIWAKTEFEILFLPLFVFNFNCHCAKFKKKLIGGFQVTLGSDGSTDKNELIELFRFMPRVQK